MIKNSLVILHRWLGLVLAPLFVIVIVSGGILAFKPMVTSPQAVPAGTAVDTARLLTLLEDWDMEGSARQLAIAESGDALVLQHPDPTIAGRYSLTSGERLGEVAEPAQAFFGTVERLHKGLLIGAEPLVEFATYAMLLVVLAGPFLAWPRLRNTVMGWHSGAGWLLLPVLVMLPLTGVLMSLHIGMPPMPRMSEPGAALSLSDGLRQAGASLDLSHLQSARRFRGGTVMLTLRSEQGLVTYAVSDKQVIALEAYLPKALHEGTLAMPWTTALNLLGTFGLLCVTGTGFYSWLLRRRLGGRADETAGADLLVAYATHTGTAARLAEATAKSLRDGGAKVSLASLDALAPERFAAYPQALLIVSTTGDGEMPEAARRFVDALQGTRLTNNRFALLALGDRHFAKFCAGGERVHEALLAAGAEALAPIERVDGPADQPWRAWLRDIAARQGWRLGELALETGDRSLTVQLHERQRLDRPVAGEPAHESHCILLTCEPSLPFRPGDLLYVRPGEGEAERCYSIGSSSAVTPGEIRLSVGLVQWQDENGEHVGKTSCLLCRDLAPGQALQVRLRAHAGFRPPESRAQPLIMVATGCGIAPFMGFLDERAVASDAGPSWLLFGNRHREGDYLYGEPLEALHRAGVLTRLDTVFSRDQAERRYVTDRLQAHGKEIVHWLLEKDAVIYVCGRRRTLGRSIDEALCRVLERHAGDTPEAAQRRLAAWAESGKLRRDLFD